MMEEINDYSDVRLKSWCIHCGSVLASVGSTEDHVPTKSLLLKPRPHHLPSVRICLACNNGFSRDEQYFTTFLSCVMTGSTDPVLQCNPSAARALSDSPALRAAIERTKTDGEMVDGGRPMAWSPDMDRVRRVILKNARGHAYFELGEPVTDDPISVEAVPLPLLAPEALAAFERTSHTGNLAGWPEVSSRMLQRVATGDDMRAGWIVVQDGTYRYALEEGENLVVRSIIWEYLATEVRWSI
ncbi:MAG: hypothetical protein EOP84_33980 [Verrucomicrobiaceae bacterium]|nr:MAG: hypothetical protein EOP84_33980 [Verrucomicrobiaceae bacterium]